jgi:hypothetical protein
MAVCLAANDFHRAQISVNTSGWDTDCNAGNVGCLLGVMLGLNGLTAGPDWRGPIADRLLISSADGGNSINDAVRTTYYIANLGRKLAGVAPLDAPKAGAQFHFSLPGSQQGFQVVEGHVCNKSIVLKNIELEGARALSVCYEALAPGQTVVVTTPTFSPREVLDMRTYDLMATPLIYPGQVAKSRIVADPANIGSVSVRLRIRAYGANDRLQDVDGDGLTLKPGEDRVISWRLPDLDGQPIAEIGIALTADGRRADGGVLIDYLRWDGVPDLALHRPASGGDFWRKAWVDSVSFFSNLFPSSFRISQSRDQGLIIHGTRQWTDYEVSSDIVIHLGTYGGIAVRVQGLRRYYAVRVTRDGQLQIVRVRDAETTVLARTGFLLIFEKKISAKVTVNDTHITATFDDVTLRADDQTAAAFTNGGIGLLIAEGALSTDEVRVRST